MKLVEYLKARGWMTKLDYRLIQKNNRANNNVEKNEAK